MAVADNMEEALTEIGFGRWQGLVMFMALLSHSIGPVQQLGSTFLSAPVPFRCSYPDYTQVANLTNITRFEYLRGLSDGNTDVFPSTCLPEVNLEDYENVVKTEVSKIKVNQKTTGFSSCPEIEYDTSTFQSTVVTEWNLVCEKAALRPLFQMTYSIGAILGSTFCGQLSDWLGRKKTLQIGGILTLITVVATSIVPWYSVMIFMRILMGTGTILTLFPTYTLISEVSPPNRRTISTMIPGITYFGFMGVLSLFSYLVPYWRRLILLCNTPLLILVPLYFIIDESPRWLIQKGRTKEAVDLLKKAANQNGVTLSSSTLLSLEKLSQMNKIFGEVDKDNVDNQGSLQMLRACFSSPGMRTILSVMPLMWCLKRALYIGIVLNANNFSSTSPFQYVALLGAMGLVGLTLSIPLSIKITRRFFVGGMLSVGGLFLFFDLAVPAGCWVAKWVLVMGGFCLVSAAFQINYIYAAELFPTVIRTRGFTFTNLVGSIGEMIIPLVTDIVVQYHWWAASVTFGCAGIIASLLLPLLPETKDRPMPETIQDVEDRYWNEYKGHGADIIESKETQNGKASFPA